MRLGSSILGGKPMRIPGIVDVYQVGTEWVARSWPKVQNQPNSAAQLLWRQKFRDAHSILKTFNGEYLRAYRAMPLPPGKMWIDVAIHSHLVSSSSFGTVNWPDSGWVELQYFDYGVIGPYYYYLIVFKEVYPPHWGIASTWEGYFGEKFEDIFKWNDQGWDCPKGKRPKKKWLLSLSGAPVGLFESGSFTSQTLAPLILVGHKYVTSATTGKNDYCLFIPPLYLIPIKIG